MPATPHTTFRLTPEVLALLAELSEARGLSRTAVIELSIRDFYEAHPTWRKKSEEKD